METAPIPFTWRAFRDSLQPGARHPYEGHPRGTYPGPRVVGKVIVDREHVYAFNPGNLVRLHPAMAEDPTMPDFQLAEAAEQSLARSRRGRRSTPLGWTKIEGAVLLYMDDHTVLPGGMCAHLLGSSPGRGIVWQVPGHAPWGLQDPVAVYRGAEPEVPIAYVMPILKANVPPWSKLSGMHSH